MRFILLLLTSFVAVNFSIAQTNNNHAATSTVNPEKQLTIINRSPKEIFNANKKFEISGKIENYIPDSGNRFITFRVYNISGDLRDTAIEISSTGLFHTELYQPFEGDIAVMYGSGDNYLYRAVYISPGSKAKIEVDASKTGNPSFVVSGKFAQTNKLIAEFNSAFNKHIFKTKPDWGDQNISDAKAALQRIKRMKEELAFLDNYIVRNKITDIHFQNWQKNAIKYQAGFDIAFYSFTSIRKRSLTHDQLMKVLKSIPLNDANALHSSSYYNFLKMLSTDFEIILNINPAYTAFKKQYGNNHLPILFEKADNHAKGISRQIWYFDTYALFKHSQTDNYKGRFQKVITDQYIRQEFGKKSFSPENAFVAYNIFQKLNNYEVGDSLKARLMKIFENEKGHYLFVDFWGSWCGPCMAEMPVYPKFIDQFNKDSINFLFLACQTTREQVMQTKTKYGISGNFILLNDNEIHILNNVLGFDSYPHHFVINPDGLVVNNSISSIESGDNPSKTAVKVVEDILSHK